MAHDRLTPPIQGEKLIIDRDANLEAPNQPKYAGQDEVNPSSLLLSSVMMLRHLGWGEAAELVEKGLENAISNKTVTYDLERQMEGATLLSCSSFGRAIVDNM